jgi:hypothetical protein
VELNFKDKLKEKGQDFDRNFKALEVCNENSGHISPGAIEKLNLEIKEL